MRVDELRRDAQPVAGALHAPFDNGVNAERLADFADIRPSPFESECRSAGNNLQSVELRQAIDDFFGDAVADEFVLPVWREVDERQYGNRFDLR